VPKPLLLIRHHRVAPQCAQLTTTYELAQTMELDETALFDDAEPRLGSRSIHVRLVSVPNNRRAGARGGDRQPPLNRVVNDGQLTLSQETVGPTLFGHAVFPTISRTALLCSFAQRSISPTRANAFAQLQRGAPPEQLARGTKLRVVVGPRPAKSRCAPRKPPLCTGALSVSEGASFTTPS
jgi:hypothetical protein